MNKINTILVAFLLILVTGCGEDFLELKPKTEVLESDFYRTEAEMMEALVASYDVLQWGGFGGYTQLEMLSDIMSDDARAGGGDANDQPQIQALEDFSVTPALNPEGFWGKYFSGINRANIVIEKLPDSNSSEDFKTRVNAEARFLRVYYFYNLWRLYGNIPLIDHLLGVDEYNYPQSTPQQVYDFMISELDDHVIGNLPVTVSGSEVGRITDGAAIALKAKIVLYNNDEGRMSEIAAELKNLIETGPYVLETDPGFVFSEDGEFCSESVFEVNHSEASNWGDWGWLSGGEGNIQVVMNGIRDYSGPDFDPGWGFSPVTQDLVDQYEAGDLRKAATVIDQADFDATTTFKESYQHTGYWSRKYAPVTGTTNPANIMINYNNNIRVIRFSDVLLMAAEAAIRSNGSLSDAQSYFNMVRERAFGDTAHNTTLTADQAGLDIIYAERRLELALEGNRYWDLIRTGKASAVLGSLGWEQGTHEYLPIPQVEIDKTSGENKLVQNNGY